MKIHLLENSVIDQIAAGEVVERPAHLVKELVENALDAGADLIEVEYDQGGRRVRVTDNGSGMGPDDLQLSIARHATSKIQNSNDLWNLHTFGFRGEALASIAAVSRLRLQSRPPEATEAALLKSEFGQSAQIEAAGGNPGTTILIEELFANIPARLKFLKSESAESAQIKTTLKALALANQSVELRVKTKGKTEQVWSKTKNFLDRAKSVLDVKKIYEAKAEVGTWQVQIAFASPHEVAGNSRQIWLFVQNRWVQDRTLQAAVLEAYRGLLMHGEFPIVCVRLQVSPDELDVNIHPTKSQVKFKDQAAAFRIVNKTLREGLEKAPWLTSAQQVAEAKAIYQPALHQDLQPQEATAQPLSFSGAGFQHTSFQQKHDTAPMPNLQDLKNYAPARRPDLMTDAVVEATEPTEPTYGYWSNLQVLGQAHLTYIVAQADDKLVFVDQHAAHERVAYEKLMRDWHAGKAEVQNLLLPLSLEMEAEQVDALMGVARDLGNLGVQIDQMSPTTLVVRAIPAQIKEMAIGQSLEILAREINEKGGSFALERKISDVCASLACHSVVRAGQALSMEQMRNLLRQMDGFALSSFCPHGRPVSVEYPFQKLERDFGRIV